jgi:hypothetical protein
MRVDLKVVSAKFSTLSLAVFVISIIAWHTQARPSLELKIRPRYSPISLSSSMDYSKDRA